MGRGRSDGIDPSQPQLVVRRSLNRGRERADRARSGFSLLEVLVAIAITSFIAGSLGNLLSTTLYQAVKARLDQRVRALIDQQVDYYTLVPYSLLLSGAVSSTTSTTPLSVTTDPIHDPTGKNPLTNFPCTVTATVSGPSGGVFQIVLSFQWQAPSPIFADFLKQKNVTCKYDVPPIVRVP